MTSDAKNNNTVIIKSKSNLSLYSLYYAVTCNEFAGSISESLRQGSTAPFEETLQWWRVVGNAVSDLIGRRDLNLRPPASETNAIPLDQLVRVEKFWLPLTWVSIMLKYPAKLFEPL